MPRTIFPLPCITPGPGTGQLETTLTAQSLLKLFKPHNPNTAQTYLLCFTQSFLETPQHRLWTMPIPHPLLHPNSFCLRTHLMLPGRPAQSGSFSWKLQLPNISFKAVVSKSVIFTYLIRTHPSYILTQVHPPSSARRETTCTPRKLSPPEDTHILWRRMDHTCVTQISICLEICLCPVMQSLQWGRCAGKGRAAWCHVPAGELRLVPDAIEETALGACQQGRDEREQHLISETLYKNRNYVSSSPCFILTVHLSLIT